ncbi:copper resistance protein CopC [Streptomyces sp. GMY02]|uniref:copper resistance CopC family protein n=1 Tax=Streptomyces sp. GMY02 TaxID=1333528 RepID=UPI001C2C7676|nr:copper resistance CopC family protein [Streptomyces sp. GMY02]QXE38468.1 copper resistance protein CopC [Streptomyces sp. GMY02]
MTPLPRTWAITMGALAGAVLGAAAVLAPPAHAHTALNSTDPADGSTLSVPPEQIALTFNEEMGGAYARVAVTGPDGRSVTSGSATAKGQTVRQALSATASAGRYTVAFRVVSTDGHPVTGSLTYTLAPAPSPSVGATAVGPIGPMKTAPPTAAPSPQAATTAASASASASGKDLGVSTAAVVGSVVLIVAAGATVFGLRQRRGRYGA